MISLWISRGENLWSINVGACCGAQQTVIFVFGKVGVKENQWWSRIYARRVLGYLALRLASEKWSGLRRAQVRTDLRQVIIQLPDARADWLTIPGLPSLRDKQRTIMR